MKKICIIGGGTFSHVRRGLALAAIDFGKDALTIAGEVDEKFKDMQTLLFLTSMADPLSTYGDNHDREIVTNSDVSSVIEEWAGDPDVKVIIVDSHLCSFDGIIAEHDKDGRFPPSGPTEPHLTPERHYMTIEPSPMILGKTKELRPDLIVVSSVQSEYTDTEELSKRASELLAKYHSDILIVKGNDKYALVSKGVSTSYTDDIETLSEWLIIAISSMIKGEYDRDMRRIDELMKKGEDNLTDDELIELKDLAVKCEKYEDTHEPLKI